MSRRCSLAHGRDLGRVLKQELGVDAGAVPADAEEQLRPSVAARSTNQADFVALLDLLTLHRLDVGKVEGHTDEAVTMVDEDGIG